jgi:hypothetical protein
VEGWSSRCQKSIVKDKKDAETRYGIKFGLTEIYCARCHRPCWPGRHTCEDVRLKKFHERRKEAKKEAKSVTTPIPGRVYESNACSIV